MTVARMHPQLMSSPRSRRARFRLATAAVMLTGGVALQAPVVAAQAAPDQPATAADAAALVAERGHELEALTEEYNTARENLAARQAAASTAAGQVADLEAQLASLNEQVATVAHTAYTGDGLSSFQAFMTSSSPDELIDRVSLLQSVAGHQNDLLEQAAQARAAAESARAEADAATVDAQQQLDAVTAQKAQLESQIADYQAQYDALTADQQQQANAAHGGEALAAPPAESVVAGSQAAQVVVDRAMAQLGDPYVWAAAGPDAFDCSGLTQFAYAAAGVALPHSSRMQATMGSPVSRAELQPGDLVYYYSPVSHIGIYIGGGKMVHASTSGEPVKVGSVDMAGYAGARRILN